MSGIAMAWAWEIEARQNEKLLLLFLADNADRFGRGPDLEGLLADAQEVCGIESPLTIRKHLDSLVARGLVTEEGGNFRLQVSPSPPLRKGFFFDQE